MTTDRAQEILEFARKKRILVVGDVMLDEFVWGKVRRISPEAPVPVVEVTGESFYPGGAANVARNVREFAGAVGILGIIGRDDHGRKLESLLVASGIDVRCLITGDSHQTSLKTRVIARHQQMVRVDREKRLILSDALLSTCKARLDQAIPEVDAVIVSDYGKGLLEQALVDYLCTLACGAGKILAIDPNPNNPRPWHATAIKPNRHEAFQAAGVPEDAEELDAVGQKLFGLWDTEMVLITLGDQGMALFQRNAPAYHAPPRAKEVFDVSGAGDTAIGLFTLALSAGATPPEAADIANHASGVVVGKLGTATLTPQELLESIEDQHAS
jgi:D-glycero-beta-D-manno-heptose-7-phosphate kinase